MRRVLTVAVSTILVLSATVCAVADTTITSDPFNLTNTTSGLIGSYYYTSSLNSVSEAVTYSSTNAVTGKFIANNINYNASDYDNIKTFLGSDASSYFGTATDRTAGAITLNGYVYVPTAGSYTFKLGSDDGSQLTIAGQSITTSLDGLHGYQEESQNVTFNKAGYYDLNVVYFNHDYNTGGAILTLDSGGLSLVHPVPEAGTLTLMIIGLAGFGLLGLRKRYAVSQ